MRVAVACDHGGFPLKGVILETVQETGHEAIDLGAFSAESSDYPDFAQKLAQSILSGQAERGILICGSGIGACIAANKIKGIYAGVCHDTYSAHQGVEHDRMNVLCLGARIIGEELAREIVRAYLGAVFSQEERHLRRVNKVLAIEARGK
ncbi:ribose 5-phosphate isomerase B [Anaerolinea thermolimosa]|uniref:ribose 5-phosphate isomerase B n=1 Tax=Anaerolinea thermolimosa TaxID=229919 RepID=UPI0007866BD4|nr:ribose 5-phosphate isomerase B [Anaerolinea thermolimosa]GAP06591.1 ribose 5-phosphate isomerase B [Anaerolinea thermolimosa]